MGNYGEWRAMATIARLFIDMTRRFDKSQHENFAKKCSAQSKKSP